MHILVHFVYYVYTTRHLSTRLQTLYERYQVKLKEIRKGFIFSMQKCQQIVKFTWLLTIGALCHHLALIHPKLSHLILL